MNLAKYQCMICGREHLLDQYCVCHTWSFSKPLKDLPLKDPCPYKSYDELERELAEARELLEDLVESIYTPSRLGIDSPPNPHWLALNNAKKYISKQKD